MLDRLLEIGGWSALPSKVAAFVLGIGLTGKATVFLLEQARGIVLGWRALRADLRSSTTGVLATETRKSSIPS